MALQKTLITPFGLTAPSAYAKITRINGDAHTLDIEVSWYATQQACHDDTPVLHRQAYSWASDTADALVAGAYLHLKTLDDFSSAVDA